MRAPTGMLGIPIQHCGLTHKMVLNKPRSKLSLGFLVSFSPFLLLPLSPLFCLPAFPAGMESDVRHGISPALVLVVLG